MRARGFAGLAEAVRCCSADLSSRIVEQGPNGVHMFRGCLRFQDHGEHGRADVRIGIAGVLEHGGDVGFGLRPEPPEEIERLDADGLRRFRRRATSRSLVRPPPAANRPARAPPGRRLLRMNPTARRQCPSRRRRMARKACLPTARTERTRSRQRHTNSASRPEDGTDRNMREFH